MCSTKAYKQKMPGNAPDQHSKKKKAIRNEQDVQVLLNHFYLINHLSSTAVYFNEKTKLDPITLLK